MTSFIINTFNDPFRQLESIAMYLLLNMFYFSHANFTNCHSIQKEILTFMTGFIIRGAGAILDVIIVNNVGPLRSKA